MACFYTLKAAPGTRLRTLWVSRRGKCTPSRCRTWCRPCRLVNKHERTLVAWRMDVAHTHTQQTPEKDSVRRTSRAAQRGRANLVFGCRAGHLLDAADAAVARGGNRSDMGCRPLTSSTPARKVAIASPVGGGCGGDNLVLVLRALWEQRKREKVEGCGSGAKWPWCALSDGSNQKRS